MTTDAKTTFSIKSWDEKPYDEAEGLPTLVQAAVKQTYSGELEGDGSIQYLMAYLPSGIATYVYVERVVGRIGEREGSFVIQGSGTYKDGAADSKGAIVPDSGTGDLTGITGEASYITGPQDVIPFNFTYSLSQAKRTG